MGLLSHISSMNQPKGGLLALAEKYGKKDSNYISWALENHFSTSCVFAPCGDFYYPLLSSGLDESSIVSCVSTTDYWNGFAFIENQVSTFNEDETAPYCQLFSNTIKNDIYSVKVLPFTLNDEKYFFLSLTGAEIDAEPVINQLKKIITSYTGEVISDAKTGTVDFDSLHANLFIVSPKLNIESSVSNFQDELQDKLKKALFIQIFDKLSKLFPVPNCCKSGKNFEIKTVIFSKEDIEEKLLEFQLNNALKNFFINPDKTNLLVLSAGCCFNEKGTSAFLEQD